MTKIIDTLAKEIKTKDMVFGAKAALKNLKDIEKIYLSNDCPKILTNDLEKFDNLIETELSKEELKEICKKDFNICVISILKHKTNKNSKK